MASWLENFLSVSKSPYNHRFSFPRLTIFLLRKLSSASSNQQLSLVEVLKLLSPDQVSSSYKGAGYVFLICSLYEEDQPS